MASRLPNQPTPVRQSLAQWEPGAHLWAPYFSHFKAGVVSIIPVGLVFLFSQPFDQAMTLIAAGGYTVLPTIMVVAGLLWGTFSWMLLHLLRFKDRLALHLGVYGVVGALALLTLAAFFAWIGPSLWSALLEGETFVRNNDAMFRSIMLAPILGAAGAVLGRWAIDREILWNRFIVRAPLPDVFGFVDKKFDKDDFKEL